MISAAAGVTNTLLIIRYVFKPFNKPVDMKVVSKAEALDIRPRFPKSRWGFEVRRSANFSSDSQNPNTFHHFSTAAGALFPTSGGFDSSFSEEPEFVFVV
jgi:hypothetical protein